MLAWRMGLHADSHVHVHASEPKATKTCSVLCNELRQENAMAYLECLVSPPSVRPKWSRLPLH